MSDVKQTVRLFKKLKAFPSLTLIIVYTISLEFIYALLLSLILSDLILNFQGVTFFYGYFLSLTFITSVGSYLILYGDKSLTFRRHLIFALFSITIFSISWITFSLLSKIFLIDTLTYFGFLLGLGIMSGFRLIISITVGTKNLLRRFISAELLPVAIILLSFFSIYPLSNTYLFSTFLIDEILIFTLWTFGATFFLYLVDMPIKQLLGVNGLTLLRGFTEKWLSKNNELFEESLDKIAQTSKTKIDIGLFYRKSDSTIKCLLINPWIHPGPFDEVGSSNLPYLLMSKLGKYGPVFVFHSATTHAFNVPKKDYVIELVNKIDTFIGSKIKENISQAKLSTRATPLSMLRFNDKFQITYQVFDDYILSIFTAAPNEVDDISSEVGELYLSSLLRKSSKITDGTFVDAHNCISSLGENVFYETPLTQDIISSVDYLLRDLSTKQFCDLKVGVAHRQFSNSLEEGYGPGGISILLTESCKKLGALIILDGNNMYPKIRETILSQINDLVDTVEILTTDTHIVNGISTTGFGYFPIGVKGNLDEIVKLIREGIIEAKNNLEEVSFTWTRLHTTTRILGFISLTKLLSGINISAKIAKYLILLLTPILILLSYLMVIVI